MRLFVLLYGLVCYGLFLFTFLYQIGFISGFVVPKTIDSGEAGAATASIVVNVLLLGLFAVQHTIMARLGFKRWWTTIIPKPIERSTFVLLTNAVLLLMNWQWRPMPEAIWSIESTAGRGIVYVIAALGWVLVLYSTLLINHLDLFGMRQVWLHFNERPYTPVRFKESVLYRWVRHPLMLGFLVAFWATPDMSQGHLLFAIVTTAYILVAVRIEERTLVALHGEDYVRYRKRVPMIVPWPPRTES